MTSGEEPGGEQIRQMQDGVREWVSPTGRRQPHGWRDASPPVLLAALCASAFSPLLAPGAGGEVGGSVTVLSTVGGGILAGVLGQAVDRLRTRRQGHMASQEDLEREIVREIERVLIAGDAQAQALRSEIAIVLAEIDAGGTAMRAAIESGSYHVRKDVAGIFGTLSAGFSELQFLIEDVARMAEVIQESLAGQDARLRAILDVVTSQATDARLVREDVAFIRRRGRPFSARASAGNVIIDDAHAVEGCPYRGLLSFDEAHAEIFYGRERLTSELVGKLTGPGPVIVTGASGAGKSSLLRAGLIPALARGIQLPGSKDWIRRVITPTTEPLTELATHLAVLGGTSTALVRGELATRPRLAHTAVWQAVVADTARRAGGTPAAGEGDDRRLVLIVDQFERVFALSRGETGRAERQAFITALCAAATQPAGPAGTPPALVVVAVRGDFWDRCAAHPELTRAMQQNHFVVGPMTEPDLRRAVTGPAEAAGLRVEPTLVDTILGDLRSAEGEAAGVLPLLSQAMLMTWENRDGNRLTVRGYGQAGGVSHAVQVAAEAVYEALPASQKMLARDLLRTMTVLSGDGRLTRRPVTYADLRAGTTTSEQAEVSPVLEALAAKRLLVLDNDTAEISHDALLTSWPRLREWIDAGRENLRVQRRISESAEAWAEASRDSAALLRGGQLAAAREWASDLANHDSLNTLAREFLDASVTQEQIQGQAERNRTRRLRRLVASLTALALVTFALAGYAFQLRHAAIVAGERVANARDNAESRDVAVEAGQVHARDASLGAQLSLAAYQIAPTAQARASLLESSGLPAASRLIDSSSAVQAVSLGPDHRTLAVAAADGTLRLWNVAEPGHPVPPGPALLPKSRSHLYAAAFSPDGQILAAAGSAHEVWLWNVRDPRHPVRRPTPLTGPASTVYSLAFSPDGHTLAAGSADQTIRLWNLARPTAGPVATLRPHAGYIESVAFSPSGKILAASGADHTVRLWDMTDPAHARPYRKPLTGPTALLYSVAFSPNGRILAAGGKDNKVWLWNMANPARPVPSGPLTGPASWVDAVSFSPDGSTIAAGTADDNVYTWSVATRAMTAALPNPQPVTSLAWDGDGHLVAGDADGIARIWAFPSPILLPAGAVNSVAFGAGPVLAVGGPDLELWNPLTHQQLAARTIPSAHVNAVAFAPSGTVLAAGYSNGLLQLWRVVGAATLVHLGAQVRASAPNPAAPSSNRSPSAQMGNSWPPEATTELSGCGRSPLPPLPGYWPQCRIPALMSCRSPSALTAAPSRRPAPTT